MGNPMPMKSENCTVIYQANAQIQMYTHIQRYSFGELPVWIMKKSTAVL